LNDYVIVAEVKVELSSPELAKTLLRILKPEVEVDMGGARGELLVKDNYLIAKINATTYSGFRASINAFLRLLHMVLKLTEMLGNYT